MHKSEILIKIRMSMWTTFTTLWLSSWLAFYKWATIPTTMSMSMTMVVIWVWLCVNSNAHIDIHIDIKPQF